MRISVLLTATASATSGLAIEIRFTPLWLSSMFDLFTATNKSGGGVWAVVRSAGSLACTGAAPPVQARYEIRTIELETVTRLCVMASSLLLRLQSLFTLLDTAEHLHHRGGGRRRPRRGG